MITGCDVYLPKKHFDNALPKAMTSYFNAILLLWQSSSKEEDHYTLRTIPQEHWSIGMSMARPS